MSEESTVDSLPPDVHFPSKVDAARSPVLPEAQPAADDSPALHGKQLATSVPTSESVGEQAPLERKSGAPGATPAVPRFSKTPMFEAMHAARYQRQELIQQIERMSLPTRHLICYVAGGEAMIDRDDTVAMADLLHNIPQGANIDLLLQTPGGDIDEAEKMIFMVRSRVGEGQFRVLIPDMAKSAGTMLALGADVVLMGDSSELGPIDPQIRVSDPQGMRNWRSVHYYIEAYETYAEMLARDPNSPVANTMMAKIDPIALAHCRKLITRVRTLVEKQLTRGKILRSERSASWTETSTALMDPSRFPTHGQMISHEDAIDMGLRVEYQPQGNPHWDAIWRLYCLQKNDLFDQPKHKIFESSRVYLTFDS